MSTVLGLFYLKQFSTIKAVMRDKLKSCALFIVAICHGKCLRLPLIDEKHHKNTPDMCNRNATQLLKTQLEHLNTRSDMQHACILTFN